MRTHIYKYQAQTFLIFQHHGQLFRDIKGKLQMDLRGVYEWISSVGHRIDEEAWLKAVAALELD